MTRFSLEDWSLKSKKGLDRYLKVLQTFQNDNPFYNPEIFDFEPPQKGESDMYFLLLKHEEPIVIMPFRKRSIPNISEVYFDVTSPYGYSGPLVKPGINKDILKTFWRFVDKWYEENNVITEFIRFDLIDNNLHYTGEIIHSLWNVVGHIISENKQWANLKHKVRTNYKRALKNDLKSIIIKDNIPQEAIDNFYFVYIKTMQRKKAAINYFVPKSFFENYVTNNPGRCAISLIYYGRMVISCEFLLLSRTKIYSFLGGTLSDYYHLRPNDFLKIEVINWGRKNNYQYYKLGGGRRDFDGLYKYKKSFFPKDEDKSFLTGRKIIDKDAYQRLIVEAANEDLEMFRVRDVKTFFPAYRRPIKTNDDNSNKRGIPDSF